MGAHGVADGEARGVGGVGLAGVDAQREGLYGGGSGVPDLVWRRSEVDGLGIEGGRLDDEEVELEVVVVELAWIAVALDDDEAVDAGVAGEFVAEDDGCAAGGSVGACIGGADRAAIWKCRGGEIIPARGRVRGYFSEMRCGEILVGKELVVGPDCNGSDIGWVVIVGDEVGWGGEGETAALVIEEFGLLPNGREVVVTGPGEGEKEEANDEAANALASAAWSGGGVVELGRGHG